MADARQRPTSLGASGLKVSKLWLGAMMFGDQTGEAEAGRIVAASRDAGINAIDTADAYAGGESERITGRLIAADRERWVLATKLANPTSDDPNDRGLSRRHERRRRGAACLGQRARRQDAADRLPHARRRTAAQRDRQGAEARAARSLRRRAPDGLPGVEGLRLAARRCRACSRASARAERRFGARSCGRTQKSIGAIR